MGLHQFGASSWMATLYAQISKQASLQRMLSMPFKFCWRRDDPLLRVD